MKTQSRLLVSCLIPLIVVGCRTTSSRRLISVIPRQASDSTWVTEHAGAAEAAKRHKVAIYWNGPAEERDVEPQIALAERAIRRGDIGLILSPSNPFALNTVIQRSLDSGMSVVIVGNPVSLKPQKHLSFVLNDGQQTGKLAAERMRTRLKGKGEVAILGYDALAPGSNDRSSAFEATLLRDAPAIQIVEKLKGPISFGQAELAAENAIRNHPHLSAIFSLDTTSTRGAVTAAQATGASGRILIIGCDHTLDLLYLLRHGAVDSLVAQDMHAMGSMAVDTIMADTQGENVTPYRVVEPTLLTAHNIDTGEIQRMLTMDWRLR